MKKNILALTALIGFLTFHCVSNTFAQPQSNAPKGQSAAPIQGTVWLLSAGCLFGVYRVLTSKKSGEIQKRRATGLKK